MMTNKRKKNLLIFQIAALCVLSQSILCMPLTSQASNSIASYINATVFWFSIIWLFAASVVLCRIRRKNYVTKRGFKKRTKLGLTHFFQNRQATIIDIIMLISLVGFIALVIWAPTQQLPGFILLALMVFSFGMHCILNGTNYVYVMEHKRGENYE